MSTPTSHTDPLESAGGSITGGSTGSTTDVAKAQAGEVKDTAVDAAQQVAGTAKDEAANVVSEAKTQASSLLHDARGQVNEQVGAQQQRLASTVHSLSQELGGMASKSDGSGPLTDLAHEGARKGGEVAHWLQDHEPADVLEQVTRFARRRPVAFLLICGAAGVVAGRLTRGAVAANTELDSPSRSSTPTNGAHALDAGTYAPATSLPAQDPALAGPTYVAPTVYESTPEAVEYEPAAEAITDPSTQVGRPGADR